MFTTKLTTMQSKEEAELRKALKCLYLELPESVAKDVEQKAIAFINYAASRAKELLIALQKCETIINVVIERWGNEYGGSTIGIAGELAKQVKEITEQFKNKTHD